MKPQLLILSDLWGAQKAAYLAHYTPLLQANYEIQFLDCCELGNIDTSHYTQENLHQQFVNGGIDIAVESLLKNYSEKVDILAFSIGGTIAWKVILAGLQVQNLYAISATRLRYEMVKPSSQITLIYGNLDAYQPTATWFEELGIHNRAIFENEGHELYQKPIIIPQICDLILIK